MLSADGMAFGGIAFAMVFGLVFGIIGTVVAGLFAWHNAPPVGGEWWFYIRVALTIIAAYIGGKIAAVVGYIAGAILGAIVGFVL